MYIRFGDIYLKPEHRDDYIRLIIEEIGISKRLEPGTIRFDISQNLEDPNVIHAYEVFTDKAAFDHHHRQTYVIDFLKTTKDWVSAERYPLKGREWKNLEPMDNEWGKGSDV